MILSIIAALDEGGGIGFENQIPWHLPGDLGRFKKLTMGHHLILGRKTYQSIGKPLPGRMMIVLSRNPDCTLAGSLVASSLQDALRIAREAGESEAFVIGGAEIYQEALPLADHLYLTVVHTNVEADTFFPEFKEIDWSLICTQDIPADEKNSLATTFKSFVRK